MTILHLDFETRSACELKSAGLDNYSKHHSTSVLCVAYAFGDLDVGILHPENAQSNEGHDEGQSIYDLINHVVEGGLVYAHNAPFELAIWNNVLAARYNWPRMKPEQMRCTMAMAYAMGLPGALDAAAAALGIEQRKDAKGSRVMMQLAKPRKVDGDVITWWDDPVKMEMLFEYCKQDVEVERALHKRLMNLSNDEQDLWFLDNKINSRGIRVDLAAIDRAIDLVTSEKQRLDQRMRAVTGNVVAGCTDVAQLTNWLRFKGVKLSGVAKADVVDMLSQDEVPDDCKEALRLRQEAAKSSTAKLVSMKERAGPDGRMRGLFQYHGAQTGRWAGRGPQPHNFPRPAILHSPGDIEDVIAHFDDPRYLTMMYGDPMPLVSDCMRSMIVAAPGKELICVDYSNIEGRVLAWLGGEEWKLQAFRDYDAGTGPDLYLLAYARAFHCSIEDARPFRQVGKVMELALGYAGGVGAFQTMARGYGVVVSDARADELKHAWRAAHPKIVKFWKDLERAAIRAVQEGGTHMVRGISFRCAGSFLWAKAASGHVLCYPYPEIQTGKFGGPALTYMAVNGLTRKWERRDVHGGVLAQNFTEEAARDVLVTGMRNAEAAEFPIVMHVHDELVAETPIGEKSVDEMTTVVSNVHHVAAGLPVAASGGKGLRYGKH